MNTEKLMRMICAGANVKKFTVPFVVGGFRYATDGKILVRIATTDADTPEPPCNPTGVCDHLPEVVRMIDMPIIPPAEMEKCRECKGTGHFKICDKCDGTGEHECDCGDFHDCGYCNGTGREFGANGEKCENCDGSGEVVKETTLDVGVGNQYGYGLPRSYCAMLAECGVTQFSIYDKNWQAGFTLDDGGFGVLMLRKLERGA